MIYLPASRRHDAAERTSASSADAEVRGTETLLLAEDDDLVRSFLSEILAHYGYRVIGAADGEEALRRFGDEVRVDAAILDVMLPRMSGREVRDRMVEARPEVRTLFISGYGPDVLAVRGVAGDDTIVIPKPIDIEQFLLTLRKVLDG